MNYTTEELLEAKRQIHSTLHKLREVIRTFEGKEDPSRYKSQLTLARRRVKAFTIAGDFIEKELADRQENQNMNFEIISIPDRPELLETAARWFHEKWGVPREAYLESMRDCLEQRSPVPRWYLALEGEKIIGGLGVIENDFHHRKDLSPNVCAVYTEPDRRCRGVAGALLARVCADMKTRGVDTLYLVTDHTAFYERYGWEFFCMVQGEGEEEMTRMYVHRA